MISTAYSPTSFNGDGVTTAFPITWDINASSEVVVTEVVIATAVETVKTLTTHYTVSGTGPFTVTAVTAPASSVRWVISRSVAHTQAVDYTLFDNFPAETHEDALDKLTMLAQDLDGKFVRALRQPNGDVTAIDYLPPKITRASKYLGFDSDGDPVTLAAPTDTALTTAFTETLLDDTNLATFLATLGLVSTTWTPTLGAAVTGDLSVTYSVRLGYVWKFAGLVVAYFEIVTSAFTHTTASGAMKISGLLHAPTENSLTGYGGNMQMVQGVTKANYTHFSPQVDPFLDTINITCSASAQTNSALAITDMPTGGSVKLSGFVIYQTA